MVYMVREDWLRDSQRDSLLSENMMTIGRSGNATGYFNEHISVAPGVWTYRDMFQQTMTPHSLRQPLLLGWVTKIQDMAEFWAEDWGLGRGRLVDIDKLNR